ncbi:ATP-binding protein [Nocardioides caldifontis]|uniref:ATP-binding protein n=1 Tax=Nocardioides caldifontis TaxID=2588938 RepID=UPI0011DF944F|nr:ATP-binding protein [Nocardioides caldifontis]
MTVLSSPVPVGRSRELSTLLEPVRPDRPAVLVVAGRPGSGRSYLVAQLRDRVVGLGYRCIGVEEELVVERTTTLRDVWRVLEAVPHLDEPASGPRHDGEGGLRARAALAFERIVETARYEQRVLEAFRKAAPLMVAVEGYTPGPALGAWVVSRLIPQLRKDSVPIVLVLSGVEEHLAAVSAVADASVTLGELDREEVAAFLRSRGEGLEPPLDEPELAAYVDAVSREPTLMDAFVRVLEAMREEASRGQP